MGNVLTVCRVALSKALNAWAAVGEAEGVLCNWSERPDNYERCLYPGMTAREGTRVVP